MTTDKAEYDENKTEQSGHDQGHGQGHSRDGVRDGCGVRDVGVWLLFVSLDRVRSRFAATLHPDPPTWRAWVNALAASARDVPLLVAELERMRARYADLVAACRAGLVARLDGENDREAWRYVEDELPPAPPGHPLHQPTQPPIQPVHPPRCQDGGGRHD